MRQSTLILNILITIVKYKRTHLSVYTAVICHPRCIHKSPKVVGRKIYNPLSDCDGRAPKRGKITKRGEGEPRSTKNKIKINVFEYYGCQFASCSSFGWLYRASTVIRIRFCVLANIFEVSTRWKYTYKENAPSTLHPTTRWRRRCDDWSCVVPPPVRVQRSHAGPSIRHIYAKGSVGESVYSHIVCTRTICVRLCFDPLTVFFLSVCDKCSACATVLRATLPASASVHPRTNNMAALY